MRIAIPEETSSPTDTGTAPSACTVTVVVGYNASLEVITITASAGPAETGLKRACTASFSPSPNDAGSSGSVVREKPRAAAEAGSAKATLCTDRPASLAPLTSNG